MLVAFAVFARAVRKVDKKALLITGNANPRNCALHNRTEGSWAVDSREEFKTVLLQDNPDPYELVSTHVYPKKTPYFSKTNPASYEDIIRAGMEAAASVKKVYFLGEFGADHALGPQKEKETFTMLMVTVGKLKVPLSALWVFDMKKGITADNERSYMLDSIRDFNRRINAKR